MCIFPLCPHPSIFIPSRGPRGTSWVCHVQTLFFIYKGIVYIQKSSLYCLNPKRTGGGGGIRPPLDVSRDNFAKIFFRAASFHDFFLSSLAQLLAQFSEKSGVRYPHSVTLCNMARTVHGIFPYVLHIKYMFSIIIHKYMYAFCYYMCIITLFVLLTE